MAEPHTEPTARPSAEPSCEQDVREVVGLFTNPQALERAVQDLLTIQGIDHGDVTVLAAERTVRERLGHRISDTVAMADDPAAPRRGWVEPESRMEGRGALASVLGYLGGITALGLTFATGGAAAVAIGAALVGAGGGAAVGAGLGKIFDGRLARQIEEQINAGGILLWVRCRDDICEGHAGEVLERHGAHHVHAHTIG